MHPSIPPPNFRSPAPPPRSHHGSDRGDRAALTSLARASHDNRWRTREGVVLGLQRTGERRPAPVIELIATWGASQDPFLERAALAALGHAQLLKSPAHALLGLDLTGAIIDRLQSLPRPTKKRRATVS